MVQAQESTITSITAVVTADSVVLRFTADDAIVAFQKPEISQRIITLRVMQAQHGAAASVDSLALDGIGVRAERIKAFLVYRVTMGSAPVVARARRNGTREILLTIDKTKRTVAADTTPRTPPAQRQRWALDVIVLDAGHGGQDAGAEGLNGIYEKDVTLAIARRLRDLIKKEFPSTKVVMTRDDDTFIELYRRGQIANDAGGKLFISIHCNSMPKKPHSANGCETYILRPGRNDDAIRVAERENSSIRFESSQSKYKGMTEDQLIVATMAQSSFVKLSEALAASIQKHVSSSSGLANRGVNQAGFYVLVNSSMPNVLFETAFLSNTKDCAYITSDEGQRTVAASMLQAIRSYAETYRSLLERQ
jgi:N-acetylmuramoyl-L-alanine amidase